MLPGQPSIPTSVTPDEIVGGMMDVFLKHFELCGSGTGDFPDKLLEDKIGAERRITIAEIYKDLRAHGFYPGYVVAGRMVWRTALKCKTFAAIEVFEPFDTPISSMSVKQMKEKARTGFKSIGSENNDRT